MDGSAHSSDGFAISLHDSSNDGRNFCYVCEKNQIERLCPWHIAVHGFSESASCRHLPRSRPYNFLCFIYCISVLASHFFIGRSFYTSLSLGVAGREVVPLLESFRDPYVGGHGAVRRMADQSHQIPRL